MTIFLIIAYNSAAWTCFGTSHVSGSWSWRIPSAIQGLPAVLQVLMIWFCPESPRWLVSKGKDAQALKTLAYYHADGNECVMSSSPLLASTYLFAERILLSSMNLKKSNLLLSSIVLVGHFFPCVATHSWISIVSCGEHWVEISLQHYRKQKTHADYHRYCLLLSVVRARMTLDADLCKESRGR